MFKINKLKTIILTDKSESLNVYYGFEFSFKSGLNIIAGPNSRGKTTVNSCIYYALGMEELLGGNNEKALDKALKEEFTVKSNEKDFDEVIHKVKSSKVILEIENDKKEIVCLERYIKTSNGQHKNSNITIYESSQQNLTSNGLEGVRQQIFFVNHRGNNDDANGFYNWLANFIGIEIPQVSNTSRVDNYSPLYLQIIFSSLFIEQTKGWSDFFATMPFFGVTRAKEKIVEFILGLNEIKLSTKKDILFKIRTNLLDEWQKKIKSFQYLEKQYNCSILNIPQELTIEKSELEKISIWFTIGENEKSPYSSYISEKKQRVIDLENQPLVSIKENREHTVLEFNKQKQEYSTLKQYIDKFENKLFIDKNQSDALERQLLVIDAEIKDHLNLQKVFSENIINEKGANHCPTCSQLVTTNLISSKSINIPQLTLEENTNFLRSQRKIIESSISSLSEAVKEKEILYQYFKNALRQKELLIKSISKDLISDDRAFAESEILKKIQLEAEIEKLNSLYDSVQELKNDLAKLGIRYYNNSLDIDALADSEQRDEEIISDFEQKYKKLLFSFGYESNYDYQISINRKEPFKYFPVYKGYKEDANPQSIRINSSASDFVRNIWAYTISLMIKGENHPGLIMFDEPGQHRTNLKSLKELFVICSKNTDKQSIIFTSIDKKLNDKESLDLSVILDGLEDFSIIRLDDLNKVIKKL